MQPLTIKPLVLNDTTLVRGNWSQARERPQQDKVHSLEETKLNFEARYKMSKK